MKDIFPTFAQESRLNRLKLNFMIKTPEIRISDYTYDLPDERIATYPAGERDASKLLIYNKGVISSTRFNQIAENFDSGSLMVFNNTKVVPARLLFRRATGAFIEIFCLEPLFPEDYNINFSTTDTCKWKCIVGNRKKWKDDEIALYIPEGLKDELVRINLRAKLEDTIDNAFIISFRWDNKLPFSKVMEICGKVPIPPYLRRETESIDLLRYQTVYAQFRGSVAAPTAGLHFTESVFDSLEDKGIKRETVCLHVGAGTFLPVKSETIAGHTMHSEPFSITRKALVGILAQLYDKKDIIAVGTTSVRTLESLYWLGRQCFLSDDPASWEPRPVGQWDPYNADKEVSAIESIGSLLKWLDAKGEDHLFTKTQIIIVPGYKFRIINKLITNFHQPQSTLLLLIAALIGENWKKVYEYALNNSFRFLSYGDSSLLIP